MTPAPERGWRPFSGPWGRIGGALLALEIANGAYLASFDSATIFYHSNVVGHVVLGAALAVWIPAQVARALRSGLGSGTRRALGIVGTLSALALVASGAWLTIVGTARPYRWLLWTHVASFLIGAAAIILREARGIGAAHPGPAWARGAALTALAVLAPLVVRGHGILFPPPGSRIENPPLPPLSAAREGPGEGTPFFPSSARTAGDRLIPADFFLESKSCGNEGCHPDIVAQWESSAHHFSSFNNQWYRKSIEYMQDVVGTKPSKWCGGCHDMAILFTGRMDTPVRGQIHTPEAQAGIGCMVCHSIVEVADTMGQGGYTIEYPEMHRLAASPSPLLKSTHDFMVRLDPAPHSATFLKPFHREQTAEFCSACHKVHLDAPVNHYRWFRGFDEYDAWQQSGVSHQGARAFYYPPEPMHCGTCHMPLVASEDAGNVEGRVHSHRFAAANSAVPFVNRDADQLRAVEQFLTSGAVTVDIFGIREEDRGPAAGPARGPALSADGPAAPLSMVPGEEGAVGERTGPARELGPVVAPLDHAGHALVRGSTVRVEVVVRTRNVGHAFPGGTIDAFDCWTELVARDDTGRILGHSGAVEDDGRGPVDEGAHFYRSVMLDARGNRIDKRNAWASRALLYARVIPPGAADTVHFRFAVPPDAGSEITFAARVNYRKFAWWNTQWSFAGVRDSGQGEFALSADHDDGRWLFTGDTSDVSGKIKAIPNLPTIVVASAQVKLPVTGREEEGGAAPTGGEVVQGDRERWNDYGIGLLLQKDLRGAEAAFRRVVEIDPGYADGYVNIARALIEEGDYGAAMPELRRALSLEPGLPKAHYFHALALKATGRYEEAIRSLESALAAFPRDRVVLNQKGRIQFLMRRHEDAIATFTRTLAIDPEDLQAHYNLMLAWRARGDVERARKHEILYARFKADEAAQSITGAYRLDHPADNNERLLIHEHEMREPGPGAGAYAERRAP